MDNPKHFLHGNWSFSFTHPVTKQFYQNTATVPGNVEPELVRMGLLGDYMPADTRHATTQFDMVDDWTYITTFDAPSLADNCTRDLVFEGIDTIAEIYLNGEKLCDCANMHREWRFPVTDRLQKKDNELKVVIHSAELWARDRTPDMFPLLRNASSQYGSMTYLRKARHSWGWDNAPRLMTSGIFRPVYLEDIPTEHFENVYYYTARIDEEKGIANLGLHWSYRLPRERSTQGYLFRLTLSCDGNTVYSFEENIFYPRGAHRFAVPLDKIKLWWPYGFGDPDTCDLHLEMLDGENVIAEWHSKWGIRTAKLIQTDALEANDTGEFIFLVNNRKVMIRGTNWKPADPLHSRADEKALKMLPFVKELNCNMVRIWGGGIYEDHPFFDYCDQNGILVWHDFMFACEITPRDDWYCEEVRKEASFIIRKLRNHPSIAVWCGDNEGDQFFRSLHRGSIALPSDQIVEREILKDCVLRNDPYRDYVESSPRIPDRCVKQDQEDFFILPAEAHDGSTTRREMRCQPLENHLYPQDQYAKALRSNTSRFIGETGPITFNPMTDNESIWECEKSRAMRLWNVDLKSCGLTYCDSHQSDYYFIRWISSGRKECREKFGRDFTAQEWKRYCTAINIVCADIFKDAIEYTRVMRWTKTGVLWWSLGDMWPMLFNYSVVDSDLHRKLPFDWIRQSQRDLALMIVRKELHATPLLYAANDTLQAQTGTYRITAYDENCHAEQIRAGSFTAAPNSTIELAQISDEKKQLLIIEWMQDGKPTHFNHFVTGQAPHPFEVWEKWNEILKKHFQEDCK